MKTRKSLIWMLISIVGLLACRKVGVTLTANPVQENTNVNHEAQPFGTNLSGAEFGSNVPGQHQQDYSYPLITDLDYFKSKNMRLIRLPFLWERLQPVMNAELDPVELKRLTDFIDAAAERDMLIIPDVHNFARRTINGNKEIIGTSAVPTAAFTDFWARLATVLKDKENIWAYGIMNEPFNMPAPNAWFNIAQETITKIRTIDTETPILIGGDSYSSAERWPIASDNLKLLTDPSDSLIYEAHVYFDATSAGSYLNSYDVDKVTPQTGVNRVRPFIEWLNANEKKGFIGEYGVPDDDSRWFVVLNNMLQYMKDNCVNGTYWSAGPRWGTYRLAIQPRNGVDRPQMAILKNYTVTDPLTCK